MKRCKLGELFKIKQGFAFKTSNYVEKSRYRLITLGNFTGDNKFKFNDAKATYYEGIFPDDVILAEGDLIIPLTEQVEGLFGNSAFIPKANGDYTFVLNQRVGKIVYDEKKVNGYYLHYLLATKSVRDQIEARASGTQQRNISPDSIYDVIVDILDYEEQEKIGKLLYDIECNIVHNEVVSSQLESLAKTLYDYWFLQFEFPNEEGKPYKSSGGKMVWNEELKKEIPEGWEVKHIRDTDIYVSDYTANGSFKGLADNVRYNEGEPYSLLVRIVDFNNNFDKKDDFIWVDKHSYDYLSKSNLFGDEIIICNVGAVGNVYRCPCFDFPMTLGPNGIVVKHEYLNNYLDLFFSSSVGQQQLKSISSGSIQSKFNKTNFRELPLLIPNKDILDRFYRVYNPIYEKKKICWKENKQLSSLRDWLLPMLMNGQVTFKD